jgi:hypothetical protein
MRLVFFVSSCLGGFLVFFAIIHFTDYSHWRGNQYHKDTKSRRIYMKGSFRNEIGFLCVFVSWWFIGIFRK